MGFRFSLILPDGSDLGEVEYPDGAIDAGDVIRINGDRKMRVLAVLPVERMGEFVDEPAYGALQVEPVE